MSSRGHVYLQRKHFNIVSFIAGIIYESTATRKKNLMRSSRSRDILWASMATVDDLAQAIARYEGYYSPGSVADRHNNPGNLRSWGNYPVVNGYVQFPDAETGWAALRAQVQKNIDRGLNLLEFFGGGNGYGGYAPSTDSNNPTRYATTVASWLGIPADAPLSSVIGDSANPLSPSGDDASGEPLAASVLPDMAGFVEAAAAIGLVALGWLLFAHS
ncbi:MAG TPA: hypothetical protein VFA28_01830 [Bryobacteraceae bacterium]|nr:hypothetical protein [Bryobacteraceae bacterium]